MSPHDLSGTRETGGSRLLSACAVHPHGHGDTDDDNQDDAQGRPAEYQARESQASPCSPVRLIWCRAAWPNTIAGMVASSPNVNCASQQARLAIASPLVLATWATSR